MSAEDARRVVETWRTGGVEAVVPLVHPDFEGEVGPDNSVEPDSYVGHAGVRRYFRLWDEAMEDITPEVLSAEDAGPDAAVIELRIAGRGVGSGIPVDFVAWTSMEFEDGLLRRMHGAGDRETALRVVQSTGG